MTTLRGAALHAGQAHQLGIDVGRQADVAWLVGGVRPSGTLQSACQPSVRGLEALGGPSSSASPDLAPPSNSGRAPPPIGEGHRFEPRGIDRTARNVSAKLIWSKWTDAHDGNQGLESPVHTADGPPNQQSKERHV